MTAADGRRDNRLPIYGSVAGALALAVLVAWLFSRGEGGVTWLEAPPEARGTWTTADERYAGRAIDIRPTTVDLRRGEGGAVAGRLEIARELFDDGTRVLRLEYRTVDGPDALELVLMEDGAMYLKNQPEIVWRVDRDAGPRPLPATEAPPERSPRWVVVLLGLGAIAMILAALARGMGRGDEPDTPNIAPLRVRGVWTTPDPRFAGQSIRIARGYSFSQFGPGNVRVGGPITAVTSFRENGEEVIALTYRRPDGKSENLETIVDRAGHMRLRGGRSIWVRR